MIICDNRQRQKTNTDQVHPFCFPSHHRASSSPSFLLPPSPAFISASCPIRGIKPLQAASTAPLAVELSAGGVFGIVKWHTSPRLTGPMTPHGPTPAPPPPGGPPKQLSRGLPLLREPTALGTALCWGICCSMLLAVCLFCQPECTSGRGACLTPRKRTWGPAPITKAGIQHM